MKEFSNLPGPSMAPFIDGGMGMFMLPETEIEMLLHEKYELLDHLRVPDNAWGHLSIGDFLNDITGTLNTKESTDIAIIGEPGSGKTFAALQIANLFEEVGITPYHIPFVDVIRDAKERGLIPQESPFGSLSPQEYQTVSNLMYRIHEQVAAETEGTPSIRIGECPGIPTFEKEDEDLVVVDRGFSAVSRLVQNREGYVMGMYGSSRMREKAKNFRGKLPGLTDETAEQTLSEFNINVQSDKKRSVVETLQRSGAPIDAVKHYEDVINQTFVLLAKSREEELGIAAESITSEYLADHPDVRTRLIGSIFIPYLLRDEYNVPEDHCVVAYNRLIQKKMHRFDSESVHYHRILSPERIDITNLG